MSQRLQTENERLRRQLADINEMLRQREIEECHQHTQAELDRRAAEQAAADVEVERIETEDLEEHRKNAWFDSRVQKALAGGDESFRLFLTKSIPQWKLETPPGWPEGVTPDQFRAVPAFAKTADDTAAKTLLGQALAARGIRI
jgi:hypothetical protein